MIDNMRKDRGKTREAAAACVKAFPAPIGEICAHDDEFDEYIKLACIHDEGDNSLSSDVSEQPGSSSPIKSSLDVESLSSSSPFGRATIPDEGLTLRLSSAPANATKKQEDGQLEERKSHLHEFIPPEGKNHINSSQAEVNTILY
jgi:hypothetical protein